jgi:hypothetical protein
MEYPLYDFHQLGFVDLVNADMISLYAGKNGMFYAN